jgi:hypothetical protein
LRPLPPRNLPRKITSVLPHGGGFGDADFCKQLFQIVTSLAADRVNRFSISV